MNTPTKKKKIIIAAVCIAVAVFVAAALIIKSLDSDEISSLSDAEIEQNDSVTLISHRGMNVLAPENTLEAAQETARFGYTHIEFDIRQTKDGVWVLMHDEDIDRTTNGKSKVSELTYKQLLGFNIDKGLGEYRGVTVPSLDEMLSLCATLGLHPVIEIKQSGTDFIEDLMNYIGHRSGDCTIITFDREQTEKISSLLNEGNTALSSVRVELYWLTSDLGDETLKAAKSDTSIGVSFNGNEAGTQEEIKKFTDAGIRLATWTIDKPERLAELYNLGITTFTTNSITPSGIPEETTVEVTENGRG